MLGGDLVSVCDECDDVFDQELFDDVLGDGHPGGDVVEQKL